LGSRDGSRWSGCLRERFDALPRGRDRLGPRPGRLDFQAPFPPAADQAGRGVKHPVAQRPGLGSGQVTVQGQELEPGEQDLPGHRRGQPRGVDPEVKGREMADPAVFPGPDRVLDPGLDPVRDVDIGGLAQPASGVRGPVRGPQGYRQPSPASNRVSWAPGWGRSRRAKTRIAAGQARSRSPPALWRSSPVSSVTCASSIQHARCAQDRFAQASSARRSRTSPRPSIAACQACSGTSRSAAFSRSASAHPTE
jgi:hypothetical protein